jgi:hypothetical protein
MSAWAAEIDQLSAENDILVVQSVGNLPVSGAAPYLGIKDHIDAGRKYPTYLTEDAARVANPAQSLQALTVGSVTYDAATQGGWQTFTPRADYPSAFSRSGPGIWQVIKPEVVEYGGDCVRTTNEPPDIHPGGRVAAACPQLVRSTMHPPGPAVDRDETGTSFAAPKVTRIAAELQRAMPDQPVLLYRALIVQSAKWPSWAEDVLRKLRIDDDLSDEQKQKFIGSAQRTLRCIGYGIPDLARALSNTDYRTTFVSDGENLIRAGECHIYQVPIPEIMRQAGDDYDIRIDVTLSYVALPRRTRRNLRRYLSTWVDWKSNNLGESLNDFRARAMADAETEEESVPSSALPWTIHEKGSWGLIRQVKRNSGTVQKDWAVVRSNTLPEHFCVAVVGHQGWSRDPDSVARYSLAVTIEILGQEIQIYEPLLTSVTELLTEVSELEAQVELEVGE